MEIKKQFDLISHIFEDQVNGGKDPIKLNKLFFEVGQIKINQAIHELPEPIKTVVYEYYFSNKQTKVLLEDLGMGRVKFYNCLHKGKYLLRERLNARYYDRAKEILYGGNGVEYIPR